MVRKKVLLFLLLCAFFWAPDALAQQTYYTKRFIGDGVDFLFKWKPPGSKEQQLSFRLRADDLETGRTEFRPYDSGEMKSHVLSALKEQAKNLKKDNVDVRVNQRMDTFQFEINGPSEAAIQRASGSLSATVEKAQTEFIESRFYYQYRGRDAVMIMPDHPRISRRYVAAMRPVAEAIAKQTAGMSPRQVIDYTLAFIQSIPYDRLESRFTSSGAGFLTPYGILYYNRGDCDSKSVAFAAILRNLYPSLPLSMVYVPQHAFIGVGLPQQRDDWALNLGGRTHVLAEPAGPALVPVGTIAPSSRQLLQANQFSFRAIP